jgi:hypothetical protein
LLVVVLAISLLLVGPVAGGAGGESSQSAHVTFQQETPTNDTRHQDPDRIDRNGDLASVQRWLAGRMAVQLEDCAVATGLGSTNVCELGDEYPDWLNKYVDVAEETGSEEDDEQGDVFTQAANETETLAEQRGEFEETLAAYEAAREAGNGTEARRQARELLRQGRAINDTAGQVVELYTVLERGSDVDLETAKRSVNRTRANVTAIVSEVETQLFVTTNLTADISPRAISFLDPGTVTGRLMAANGSAVANEPIILEVGGRVLRTETDATGRFAVEYRPTTVPVSTDQLTVRYRPASASVYLGDSVSVGVTITQVTPTVEISVVPQAAGFGDTVRINGSVAAEDVPAAGVPVRITLAGQRLDRVNTSGEGGFGTTADLGAFIGPGQVPVRAAVPLTGRAMAENGNNSSLTVLTTPTRLSLDGTQAGPATMRVSGRLVTDDGRAVPDQRVTVLVNGTPLDEVRSSSTGRFEASIEVPEEFLAGSSNVTLGVAARFTGADTNLEASRAADGVVFGSASTGDGTTDTPLESAAAVAEAVVGAVSNPAETARSLLQSLAVWHLLGLVLLGLGLVTWWLLPRRYRRTVVSVMSWVLLVAPLALVIGRAYTWIVALLQSLAESIGSKAMPTQSGGAGHGEESSATNADLDSERPQESRTAPDSGPLEGARAYLDTDSDQAVMLAYGTVRETFAAGIGRREQADATHWEFLSRCREDGLEAGAIEGLTELTERYEQAAYSPGGVSRSEAQAALQTAESLL